jgi:chromosome segregation ATPase
MTHNLIEERDALRKQVRGLQAQVVELQRVGRESGASIESLTIELETSEARVASIETELDTLKDELSLARKSLADWSDAAKLAEKALEHSAEYKRLAEERIAGLKQQIETLRAMCEERVPST